MCGYIFGLLDINTSFIENIVIDHVHGDVRYIVVMCGAFVAG